MKETSSNSLAPIIAQVIEEMKAEQGKNFSLEQINLAELGRRTGLSRAKLSHLMDAETWMNAHKAMELGFSDGLLEDEKKSAAPMESYAFSSKAVAVALMNKLVAKAKPETKPGPEPEAPAGRSVDELKAHLETIKKYM